MPDQYLRLYLQDHLAANTGALALARRCRRNNPEQPLAGVLERVIDELHTAQREMRRALEAVGGSESWLKAGVARFGELLGRFKPNEMTLRYTDLARIYELETLIVALESQTMVWRTLSWAKIREQRLDGFDFESLAEQAERQRDALIVQREQAIEPAFTPSGSR